MAKEWTETKIASALAFWCDWQTNIVIPNYATGLVGWEADLIMVRKSGWAEEFEIKCSLADYRKEFKDKEMKHRQIKNGQPKQIRHPYTWDNDPLKLAEWAKVQDDPNCEACTDYCYGDGTPSTFLDWSQISPHYCKKFWFVMPSELAHKLKEEIPEYAGLIEVTDRQQCKVVKDAPVLKHCQKVTPEKRAHILGCAYFRFWNLARKQRA